jgi:hypothetical protein
MSGSKLTAPLLVACLLISGSSAAFAASRSELDINDAVPASHGKDMSEYGTYVRMPAGEGDSEMAPQSSKQHKVVAKGSKLSLPKISMPKLKSGDKEVKTAKLEVPRHSGSSLDKSAHGLAGGLANKTKGFTESIANAAKSSGSLLVKGTKAIGSGLKNGSEAVGSKVAGLPPFSGHSGGDKDLKPAAPVKAVASTPVPAGRGIFGQVDPDKDWSATSTKLENQPVARPVAALPTVKGKKDDAHKGLLGKTVGHLPFLAGRKNSSL